MSFHNPWRASLENCITGDNSTAPSAQPAGDAGMPVVAPLDVFSHGPWTYQETGQSFTGAELNAEAFNKYKAAIAARDARIASAERYSEIGKLFMNYYVSLITVGVTDEERDVEWETLKVAAQACLSGEAMRSTP